MKIATGQHRFITTKQGDSFILSSSIVPGNEGAVQIMKDTSVRTNWSDKRSVTNPPENEHERLQQEIVGPEKIADRVFQRHTATARNRRKSGRFDVRENDRSR